jgi:hypothetical protein
LLRGAVLASIAVRREEGEGDAALLDASADIQRERRRKFEEEGDTIAEYNREKHSSGNEKNGNAADDDDEDTISDSSPSDDEDQELSSSDSEKSDTDDDNESNLPSDQRLRRKTSMGKCSNEESDDDNPSNTGVRIG